jgi:trans-2,3-dihydro-3-hydroxyanthranilate isomerase
MAREFNLSETTFPLPSTVDGADYRVRIFTPASELPFAGHPSIGTAWVLARDGVIAKGDLVQECAAGLMPISVDSEGARLTGGTPSVGSPVDPAPLLAAAGLQPSDVDSAAAAGQASAGLEFTFLLVNADAVARARPRLDVGAMGRQAGNGLVVLAFDRERRAAHLRMFAPDLGVTEDPATGSAALALGVWLVDRGLLPADGESQYVISQGIEIGRPSTLECTVTAEGGAALRCTVRGGVVPVASGRIAVPSAG